MTDLLRKLREIVGEPQVLTASADTEPYLTDWRKRYRGTALAVVRPATADEVMRSVRACAEARAPMVPLGGNTGLVGAATPDSTRATPWCSLGRMNRIRAIDPANDTITVEAGCVAGRGAAGRARPRGSVSAVLAAEGQLHDRRQPVDQRGRHARAALRQHARPRARHRSGAARRPRLGRPARLAQGQHRLRPEAALHRRRGHARHHHRGRAEAVPPPRAAGDSAGRDHRHSTRHRSAQSGARRGGPELTAFEIMSQPCIARAVALPAMRAPLPLTAPWSALLELSDHESEAHGQQRLEAVLGDAVEREFVNDAVVARSLAEASALWRIREGIPEAHSKAGGNVKHDIALPVSVIPQFVERTNAQLQARFPWIAPAVFGHLGDGNLHYNMGTQAGTPIATAFAHEAEINAIVYDAVVANGGSISAEHGIGQLKRDQLVGTKSATEINLMRTIKQALDPLHLMNPGKVL